MYSDPVAKISSLLIAGGCLIFAFANAEKKQPGDTSKDKGSHGQSSIEWHYDPTKKYGPSDWTLVNAQCGGVNQSPIAFFADEITVDESLKELRFSDYDKLRPIEILNNGHTIKAEVQQDKPPTISGGNLSAVYRLVQLHFHWGPVLSLGSEHKFGYDHFPLEMHMVHVKEKLTFGKALEDPKGLLVLGIFFELSNEFDNALSPVSDQLSDVLFKGKKVKLKKGLNLTSLLPRDTSNFFTYQGSLTTPPCTEVVTWILFTKTHAISAQQLQAFRNVHLKSEEEIGGRGESDVGNKLLFNHRPIQPVNGRKILARRHKNGLAKQCLVYRTSGGQNYGTGGSFRMFVSVIVCFFVAFGILQL